ncbi:uncharacterized protein LOC108606099 [Drosophila busckii]|uniref:uncharacterized protein LOC108606099 n=1 Tax=Drosophila busckii TaxID=30019 RepID=UPI00143312B6|nr:uncharacterized protein LOC108606099 [Drosophila busckii]
MSYLLTEIALEMLGYTFYDINGGCHLTNFQLDPSGEQSEPLHPEGPSLQEYIEQKNSNIEAKKEQSANDHPEVSSITTVSLPTMPAAENETNEDEEIPLHEYIEQVDSDTEADTEQNENDQSKVSSITTVLLPTMPAAENETNEDEEIQLHEYIEQEDSDTEADTEQNENDQANVSSITTVSLPTMPAAENETNEDEEIPLHEYIEQEDSDIESDTEQNENDQPKDSSFTIVSSGETNAQRPRAVSIEQMLNLNIPPSFFNLEDYFSFDEVKPKEDSKSLMTLRQFSKDRWQNRMQKRSHKRTFNAE